MREKLAYILIGVFLLTSVHFMGQYKAENLETRRFIGQNVSKDFRLFFNRVADVQVILSSEEQTDIEQMINSYNRALDDIRVIGDSLANYEDLNEAFLINVYTVETLLRDIGEAIEANGYVAVYQEAIVNQLLAINKEYQMLSKTSTYTSSVSGFKKMPMPEAIRQYEEAMNQLYNDVLAKATLASDLFYELEQRAYPEDAKIDLILKKMDGQNLLWQREWTDIYLTELDPYSKLVEDQALVYIEVTGQLYVIDGQTGDDVFDPVKVGVGELPIVDDSGNIYCIGYYEPFATKVNPEGVIEWQIDSHERFYWPWRQVLGDEVLIVDCQSSNSEESIRIEIDRETGAIREE